MRHQPIITAAFVVCLFSFACWSHKQQFYTTVTNHSTGALHSIEVDYPGGSYGIDDLAAGASNQKWVFASGPCQFTIRFVDQHGKQYSPNAIDISKMPCTGGITLTIEASMNVTATSTAK